MKTNLIKSITIHSLDKLTQEIDGKVGIVELAKKFHKNEKYQVTHYENINTDERRYSVNCCVENDSSRYMYYQIDKDVSKEPYAVVDYLLEKGYNVFGLSSEFVKEKSL